MDTVPFLLCELGAPLFTNLKGAGTYFMCIPAMNRRMYKTLVDITSAGVFCCYVSGRNCRWQVLHNLSFLAIAIVRSSAKFGASEEMILRLFLRSTQNS